MEKLKLSDLGKLREALRQLEHETLVRVCADLLASGVSIDPLVQYLRDWQDQDKLPVSEILEYLKVCQQEPDIPRFVARFKDHLQARSVNALPKGDEITCKVVSVSPIFTLEVIKSNHPRYVVGAQIRDYW